MTTTRPPASGASEATPSATPEANAGADPETEASAPARPAVRGLARLRLLDRNVTSLGFVSFFADVSSEMLYPIFPIFVTTVLGAPVALLGLIEGIAEATASITKYPFGQLSDATGRRRPWVIGGYGLSALAKGILALAFVWPVALVGRFTDRLGKGLRTAPRDALIAASATADQRGIAFGLHRSLDTLGAVLGPLVALAMIELHLSLRTVFALAVIPGVASVAVLWWLVKERASAPRGREALRLTMPASAVFRWVLASAVVFGIGNSSDMFILLKAKSVGVDVASVILLYVLYNLTYAGFSLPLGSLSDRVGQLPVVLGGYVVFALVYVGFAASHSWLPLVGLFALYGVYIAGTEGTSKALVANVSDTQERGATLGLYYTVSGVATFAASAVGGGLWSAIGPWATFTYGAACALAAAAVLAVARLKFGARVGQSA
jgi:MFS family permease